MIVKFLTNNPRKELSMMSNKRFVNLLVIMFLCFVVLFGSAGCGGDNKFSNFAENAPTNPAPNPVPTPIVSSDTIPEPTTSDPELAPTPIVSPDPVPQPEPVSESPDVPEPTPVSPDQPVPDHMPVVSPDPVPPTPLPEPEPAFSLDPMPMSMPEPEPNRISQPVVQQDQMPESTPVVPSDPVPSPTSTPESIPVVSSEPLLIPVPTTNPETVPQNINETPAPTSEPVSSPNPVPTPSPRPTPLVSPDQRSTADPVPTFNPEPATIKFIVMFDSKGGSSVPSQNIQSGKVATKPENPSKEGFTFSGWYADQSLTTIFNFTTPITSNLTLYAKWTYNVPAPMPVMYSVTFNTNGGSIVPGISVNSGMTIDKPVNPERSGYSFSGWYKDSALSEAFNFGVSGDKITQDITLYAKWTENAPIPTPDPVPLKYTVIFDSQGGTTVETQNVEAGKKATEPIAPSKDGYVFNGWFADIAFTTPFDFASLITNNLTLYAKWLMKPSTNYTVTFNSNGGSNVADVNIFSGGTVDMPENPTRIGYVFAGWFKDETFTNMFVFGDNGDKITEDTTLYAQWLNADTLRAEYALGEIVIGYADGDNPKYVTQNLMLPSNTEDVNVTWSSNNVPVISPAGEVTRPQYIDTNVTLTATATSGAETATRDFTLKVIRARSRESKDVEVITPQDAGSEEISIVYTASGDQITDIEGNYSKFLIQNADDALDAIQAIHEDLGVSNPYEELKPSIITSDSAGAEYQFQQVYDGVKVYGYGIMASANSSGKADFLHANILSTDILEKLDRSSLMLKTSSDADAAVKSLYSGKVDVASADTELIIFALGEYENTPVYAYVVNISGFNEDERYFDENVIINAISSEVILKSSNIYEASSSNKKIISGKNELNEDVSFPIQLIKDYWQIRYDTETPTIEIYSGDVFDSNIVKRKPGEEMNGWDTQAVSAYLNMREILQWWNASFDRNSLDDKGMTIKVIVHQNWEKNDYGNIKKDNARWVSSGKRRKRFYICDKEKYVHSFACAVDILTHESTHAVLQYVTGINDWVEESPLRAITEGYADVFACIKDKNWKIGEDLYVFDGNENCLRNIETQFVGDKSEAYIDSVHYVSHLAYLMYKNGLTWDELGKIWYKSMSMGQQSTNVFGRTKEKNALKKEATFENVYKCVRWAAEKLTEAEELSDEKLKGVEAALAKLEYQPAYLSGTVTDYKTGRVIANASVNIDFTTSSYNAKFSATTNNEGKYSKRLFNESGTCTVQVNKDGYEDTCIVYDVNIKAYEDKILDFQVVERKQGEYAPDISGAIRDSSDNFPLKDVSVFLMRGWNNLDECREMEWSMSTDIDGKYLLEAVSPGHYTIKLSKANYNTCSSNIIIGEGTDEDIELNFSMQRESISIDEAHFPDENFRNAVRKYDTDNDGMLSNEEIAVIKYLGVSNSKISTLKGIEFFTSLEVLDCSGNQLTTLDVSYNTALTWLECSNNQLVDINVGNNSTLETLDCYLNQLTTLNLSGLFALTTLHCHNNKLTTLNFNECVALAHLTCDNNQITALDLSNCKNLERSTLMYDWYVNGELVDIIFPSTASTASTNELSYSLSGSFNPANGTEIIATIPAFTPKFSGMYPFTVSLDHEPPEVSCLVLLSDSEDLNGLFSETASPLCVNVSVDLTAGRTYNPVIVAHYDAPESSNGGCNTGMFGMLIFAGMVMLIKKP